MPPPLTASQPARTSGRVRRTVERFRFDAASQPIGGRAVSPPPSPVRLEVVGIGEEEAIVELGELVHEEDPLEGEGGEGEGGVEAAEAEGGGTRDEALLNLEARRVRGVGGEQ